MVVEPLVASASRGVAAGTKLEHDHDVGVTMDLLGLWAQNSSLVALVPQQLQVCLRARPPLVHNVSRESPCLGLFSYLMARQTLPSEAQAAFLSLEALSCCFVDCFH